MGDIKPYICIYIYARTYVRTNIIEQFPQNSLKRPLGVPGPPCQAT